MWIHNTSIMSKVHYQVPSVVVTVGALGQMQIFEIKKKKIEYGYNMAFSVYIFVLLKISIANIPAEKLHIRSI